MNNDFNVKMGVRNRGGSLQGYLPPCTFKDVVKVFGKPTIPKISGDGKVKKEWQGLINGEEFTIYDYKSGVSHTKNTDWHIGGDNKVVADWVVKYFLQEIKK